MEGGGVLDNSVSLLRPIVIHYVHHSDSVCARALSNLIWCFGGDFLANFLALQEDMSA